MDSKELAGRLRELASQIDPCLLGGRDATLLLNAATHIAAQDARMEALEEALRTEIWNGSKQRGMSDNAAMALVKTRIAALGGEQHGG